MFLKCFEDERAISVASVIVTSCGACGLHKGEATK